MKRFKEATPLADRDEYQAWQKKNDEEESKTSKERFKKELDSRNSLIYNDWRNLAEAMENILGRDYPAVGFDEFLDYNEPYLKQTGYYDSDSFNTDKFYYNDTRYGGIGVGVYYKDSSEAGGDVYEEFIPKLKREGGAELDILAGVGIPDEESQSEIELARTPEHMLNLYAKYLIQKGDMSRKEVSEMIRMLEEFVDGSAKSKFPGATRCDFFGLEAGRPMIVVDYPISVNPTSEEIENVTRGLEELYNLVMFPRIH